MLIFVSYTLRDGVLSMELLRALRDTLPSHIDTYIDILDNDAPDPQAHVFAMLERADLLLAFETRDFYRSEWTKVELEIAVKRNIPVLRIPIPIGTSKRPSTAAEAFEGRPRQLLKGKAKHYCVPKPNTADSAC